MGGTGCDHNGIIGLMFRPSEGTVPAPGNNIPVSQFLQNGSGFFEQLRILFNGIDLAAYLRQNSGLVTAAYRA